MHLQIGNSPSGAKVLGAPGKSLPEKDFIAAVNAGDGGVDDIVYRLPEYVTSFLLARDTELEFSNLNRKAFRDTVSTFTKETHTTQYFFYKSTKTKTRSSHTSTSKVHRTANGMKIMIPGAQVIGYYTQKLPQFPAGDKV